MYVLYTETRGGWVDRIKYRSLALAVGRLAVEVGRPYHRRAKWAFIILPSGTYVNLAEAREILAWELEPHAPV